MSLIESSESISTNRNAFTLYAVAAILITAICWVPTAIIASANGYILPSHFTFAELVQNGFSDSLHLIIVLIFSIGAYGPFIAAIIAIYLEVGRSGISDLFRRMTKWRVDYKWYLWVILIPVFIALPAFLMGIASGLTPLSTLTLAVPLNLLLPLILWQTFTSGLEEPGWRGYALPKLQEKHNAETASIRLGVLWSVWHWPYITYLTISTAVLPGDIPSEMVGVVLGIAVIQTLFLHAVSTAGIAVIYTWFYNNTESVLIAILFHMAVNVVSAYLQASPALSVITGIMPWVVAIVLLRKYGKDTLTDIKQKGEISEVQAIPEKQM
ncbi:MAG: CPBP family intramembrane glutamic endopeptidase [Candidatus Thorarchaeota archaeon]|jgi:membrane protease YdiL (CAAX protease family)